MEIGLQGWDGERMSCVEKLYMYLLWVMGGIGLQSWGRGTMSCVARLCLQAAKRSEVGKWVMDRGRVFQINYF